VKEVVEFEEVAVDVDDPSVSLRTSCRHVPVWLAEANLTLHVVSEGDLNAHSISHT